MVSLLVMTDKLKISPISDLMKTRSAALYVFCVYKRTEDGGQSEYNNCSAAKTPDARAKKANSTRKKKSSLNKHPNEQTQNQRQKPASQYNVVKEY
jgi:hypothetical protein